MTIFPAVDIKGGKAVRLRQGKKDEVTIFSDDPLSMALHWQNLGAEWLHVVDLDGAFEHSSTNIPVVAGICSQTDIPVQLGGGIRELDDAARYLNAGVSRLIVGTVALEKPKLFAEMCGEFPGRIGVSLDAVNGSLKSRGWVHDTGIRIRDIVPELEDAGASFIVYTDIERDGMQTGVNLAALENLLSLTSLPVVVAGGVANLEDIKNICSLDGRLGIEGIISGRALYEKTLDLPQALAWLASHI